MKSVMTEVFMALGITGSAVAGETMNTDSEVLSAVDIVLRLESFDPGTRDMLRSLFECGPVWDGDVLSKTSRDRLIELRWASRAVVRGESGFTVCTYLGAQGYRVLKVLDGSND